MATYKDGRPVAAHIVEGLIAHQSMEVLWWRHNLATGPSFIRELNLGFPRQHPLPDDDFVVLTSMGKEVTHGHGHWMSYGVVDRGILAKAHPRCGACRGTGVHTLSYFGSSTDYVCSCTGGRVYIRVHHHTLREVPLDRYHVVVMVADCGRGWIAPPKPGQYQEVEAETIGKFTSPEVAEAEAEKRRREPRFQHGTYYYIGSGPVVAVRVVERPLPEWA